MISDNPQEEEEEESVNLSRMSTLFEQKRTREGVGVGGIQRLDLVCREMDHIISREEFWRTRKRETEEEGGLGVGCLGGGWWKGILKAEIQNEDLSWHSKMLMG